jgi:excisionase family DNA binding protein
MCTMHRDDLLTIAQVAEATGKSRWTVWRWVKDGQLVATQLDGPGSVHVITRAELDRFLTAPAIEANGTSLPAA